MFAAFKKVALSTLAGLVVSASAFAQQAGTTEQGGDVIPTVFAFNQICYSRLPNVASIGQMATEMAWPRMAADELKAFETAGTNDVLDGWDALIGERIYRIAVTQGPAFEAQVKTFPDFAGATTSTCTMVLDGLDDPAVIAAEMQALAGKDPVSEPVVDGGLTTTTWAGGNADVKVFLVSSLGGEKGGFLSVTVLTK